MENKILSLMRVKQGTGGETRRITIPASWIDAVGGQAANKIKLCKFGDGLVIVKESLEIDEIGACTIQEILHHATHKKPKPPE